MQPHLPAEVNGLSLPKRKAADQVYCPPRGDRKEAYKISNYLHVPIAARAPRGQAARHACKSTSKHKLVPSLRTHRCLGKAQVPPGRSLLQCHLCSSPRNTSVPLAVSRWTPTPARWWHPSVVQLALVHCFGCPPNPRTTVLGHSVPKLSQAAQLMPLPVGGGRPGSPWWAHQDIGLCSRGLLAKGRGSELVHTGAPTHSHPITP